ncbi:unnamed protein product, partial [Owenia fusiformis]
KTVKMAEAVKQNFDSWKVKLDKKLHEENSVNDALAKVEAKTGVRRLYLVLGLVAFLALYLMVGYGAQFLCNFLGFLYPAYASVKAIESTRKDDDTQWLTYWVVYSAFSLVEFFADIFLFWIPFYWLLKCIFLVYCFAPFPWNGSNVIYNRFIRPFILRHQEKVDDTLDKMGQAAEGLANDAISEAAQAAARNATKLD